jgi:hypothetical protein
MGNGASVRNVLAFHVLHTVFVKAKTDLFRELVVDEVQEVFTQDPANYFITEPQHTVATFISQLSDLSDPLRRKVTIRLRC